ncbi:glycosyltransferase, partial [Hazenella sp. IB182357]
MDLVYFSIFFLCTVFPIFHMINAIPIFQKKNYFDWKWRTQKKGFSILIPCYNEQSILETTLNGLLKNRYPEMEVIFINDGSTDETLYMLGELLELIPVCIWQNKNTQFGNRKVQTY